MKAAAIYRPIAEAPEQSLPDWGTDQNSNARRLGMAH